MSEKFNEQLFQSILESSLDGIIALKSIRNKEGELIDFKVIFANPKATEILQKSGRSKEISSLKNAFSSDSASVLFEQFRKVIQNEQPLMFEHEFKESTLNEIFRISAVKLNDGLTVTFRDISEEVIAEINKNQQKRRFDQLFEESIDGIFSADSEFTIEQVNHSFLQIFKIDNLKTDTGLEIFFYNPLDFEQFKDQLLNHHRVEEYELSMITQNGDKRFCIINCIGAYEKITNSYTYLGVIKDVTKRRQLNRQLVRAEKLNVTGKIARTIAHEVRNPLTNLSLALDQLKDEIEDKVEDADLYVSIIERNSSRIGDLINDLLDSSRPREVKLRSQSLERVIEKSVNLIEDRIKLKNMSLDMDLKSEIPQLMIDESQIEIALSNIFINAIEAMKEDKGVLRISVQEEDDNVLLQISDNGNGIPEEDLDGLFEPYFTSKKQGTGLGLTTVQNILNAHQTSISVESQLGIGTTFKIYFPINP